MKYVEIIGAGETRENPSSLVITGDVDKKEIEAATKGSSPPN